MIRKWYKNHFKKKFFNKILVAYSAILVISILMVAILISRNVSLSFKQKQQNYNDKVQYDITGYIEQRQSLSKDILQGVYINNSLYTEISYLINNGYNKHIEYKLDRFYESKDNSYNGFEKYFESQMTGSSHITGINIYSKVLDQGYVFSDIFKVTDSNLIVKNSVDVLNGIQTNLIIPCHKAEYDSGAVNREVYSVIYPFIDRFSKDITGLIGFDFDISSIDNLVLSEESFKGNVLVSTKTGQVIFNSGEFYDNGNGIDSNSIKSINIVEDTGITVMVTTPESQVYEDSSFLIKTTFFISILSIILAIILSYITIRAFSKRIKLIIGGFKKVRSGDLKARIPIEDQNDEISEMALDFNSMCEELEKYIQKTIESELKQKTAEINALQAQINPHFLYNTLEAIRMRALTHGAEDVGDMIYILSELFKYSVKGNCIVSIKEELEYSIQYLKLFEIRHANKLKVEMDIEEDVLHLGIIKHILQPLIENSIKHAVNTSRDDNVITLRIYKNGNLFIHVRDNGTGIEKNRLERLKESLKHSASDDKAGLGLVNVNERIKLFYGNEYGLDIISNEGRGTEIKLIIPVLISMEGCMKSV